MANRALGDRRIGVDLNAHCSFALNRASEIVGEIVAVEVANKKNAPKAGIRSGSVREVSGYAVSFDETASVESTLIFLGQVTQVEAVLKQVWDERFCDTEFIILKNILEILEAERDADIEEYGFLDGCSCFADAYAKWLAVKFKLRREKYAPDEALPVPQISKVAAGIIRNRTMLPVGGKKYGR